MAKKVLIFIAGVVTGIILMFLLGMAVSKRNSGNNGITLFDTAGDCVGAGSFEVIQVLGSGDALATEQDSSGIGIGVTVLFLNDGNNAYYDDQIINIPSGKCARQIGVFRYENMDGMNKTVPVVKICDK